MNTGVTTKFSHLIEPQLALHPSVYITCLAAHEKGSTYGRWVNADQSVQALESAIQQMLANSPVSDSKAWIITDSHDLGDTPLSELTTGEDIHAVASFFAQYGRLGMAALKQIRRSDQEAIRQVSACFDRCYCGVYPSKLCFANRLPTHGNFYPDEIAACSELEPYFFLPLDDAVHVFRKEISVYF
jgi:hypothetical protein